MDGTSGGREEEAKTPDPRSCSSSNQASQDSTDGGREEEVGTPNPHPCSSSNQASIALAAIEQVWMLRANRRWETRTLTWVTHDAGWKSQLCCTKNLMRPTPASDFGWKKRDFFLVRLRGRNIFGLCLPCSNWAILSLEDTRGFWRGLGSFTLILSLTISLPKS